MSHAASAFYNSGFDQTAILIMDAVGEFATTSIGFTKGNKIIFIRQIHFIRWVCCILPLLNIVGLK